MHILWKAAENNLVIKEKHPGVSKQHFENDGDEQHLKKVDRVAEIRQGRNSFKPTQFFKHTDPNSIFFLPPWPQHMDR